MIRIRETYKNDKLVGFEISGHGNTAVCAAVSALSQAAITAAVNYCQHVSYHFDSGRTSLLVGDMTDKAEAVIQTNLAVIKEIIKESG